MPFGKRTIAATGETVDFDGIYQEQLKAAATDAGWQILRIDDLVRPGMVTDHYLQELFTADLVIADITDHNANVFYELGVRQAISTSSLLKKSA